MGIHSKTYSSVLGPRPSFGYRSVRRSEDRVEIRALELRGPDEHVSDGTRFPVDEERRRTSDVDGVEANGMPHAVPLDDAAILVAENRKRKRRRALRHALRNRRAALAENHHHADVPLTQPLVPIAQLTELPPAVRSPHSSVEDDQKPTVPLEQAVQRPGGARGRLAKLKVGSDIAEAQRRAGSRH